MSYLLTLEQNERRNIVGVFRTRDNAVAFLESIPFLEKREDEFGTEYRIPLESLPDSFPVRYNGWQYLLSRFSYSEEAEDGDVEAILTPLCQLDAPPPAEDDFVRGTTLLDAFLWDNRSLGEAIRKREKFYREASQYYGERGWVTGRGGLGSQDGEYITVWEPSRPECARIAHLMEPCVIEEWERAGSFAAWIGQGEGEMNPSECADTPD